VTVVYCTTGLFHTVTAHNQHRIKWHTRLHFYLLRLTPDSRR